MSMCKIHVGPVISKYFECKIVTILARSADNQLDLNLSITNGIVSSKIYDKWDDFNFEKVNFPFLDGDVPSLPFLWCIYF